MHELTVLFLSAFFAATLLPIQSELVLAALRTSSEYSTEMLLIVVTAGNVLGALLNWFLGRYLVHFKDRKWFPIKEKSLNKATRFYQKWGVWSLLLAWMPFIGDPLTMIAGMFRLNLPVFLLLVTIGKAARYIFILWLIPGVEGAV